MSGAGQMFSKDVSKFSQNQNLHMCRPGSKRESIHQHNFRKVVLMFCLNAVDCNGMPIEPAHLFRFIQ